MVYFRLQKRKGWGTVRDTIKPSLRKQSSTSSDQEITDKSGIAEAPGDESKNVTSDKLAFYRNFIVNANVIKW